MAERRRKSRNESSSTRRRRRGDNNSDSSPVAVLQTINVEGSVKDIEDNETDVVTTTRRRRARKSAGSKEGRKSKRKSRKFPEVDLNNFREPPSETMSVKMCEACKNKDLRILQDNFNVIFLTMNQVAAELDINDDNWKTRLKKMRDWALKRQYARVQQAHKRATDKEIKRAMRKQKGMET